MADVLFLIQNHGVDMHDASFIVLIPILAVIMDLLLADPYWLPHPVAFIGKILSKYESFVRDSNYSLKLMGGIGAFGIAIAVFIFVKILIAIPFLGAAVAFYLAYTGLALGSLLFETKKAANLLDKGLVEEGRKAVSMLVSRDVTNLDIDDLRKALAETTAENLNDGFVAPFFYLIVTGPAGMWAYKTISTMDSMWGYKTEEYKDFGYYAAKTDDVLAFIPARITGFVMLGAGRLLKLDWRNAYDNLLDDSRKTESPNAGWPMAAAAWLIGAEMGGDTVYFGEVKQKPIIGVEGGIWTSDKISKLFKLVLYSGVLCAILLDVYSLLIWLA